MAGKNYLPRNNDVRTPGRKKPRALAVLPVSASLPLSAALGLCGVAAWAEEPPSPKSTPPKANASFSPIPEDPFEPGEELLPPPRPGTERSGVKPGALFPPTPDTVGGTANASSLLGKLGENLNISGSTRLTMRANDVSGGAFGTQNYNSEFNSTYDSRRVGFLENATDVTIQGKAFNVFNINARLSNSRYGNYVNQTFGLNYKSKGTTIDVGDVNASLTGNSLVSFSKSLQGLMFSRDFGGGKIRSTNIVSLTKAETRRGAFQGNDTNGPYYLNASTIVEGTERLRLNGVELQRDRDYTVDYLQGIVYFFDGSINPPAPRIIPPGATVDFSYESQSYNATPGLLYGTRLDFMAGKGSNFGVTWLQQKSTGRQRTGDVTERFPVYPDILYRYILSSLIEPGTPVEVKWFEETLVEGIDYVLNRDQHYFQFKRALPPDTSVTGTASLRVRYRPVRTSAVGGDRSVMGLDGNVKIGQSGSLNLQFGQSQSPDKSSTGSAMSLTASFKGGGRNNRNQWTLNTSYRDIGEGFSNIDSTVGAFLRAEKGFNTNLTFAPSQFINFTSSFTQSRLAQTNFSSPSSGQAVTWANNTTLNAGLAVNLPNLPSLSFNHSQVTQDGSSRSTFTSDSLNLSWQKGFITLSGALGRTTSRGVSVFSSYGTSGNGTFGSGTGLTTAANDSSSDTSRFSLQLTPAAWVSLTGNIGFSNTRYGSSSSSGSDASNSSRARDTSYGLTLNPLKSLTIQANYSDTSNGQSLASYYNTGPTIGSGSSLFPTSSSGQRTQTRQLSVQYRPFASLGLSFDTNRQLSLIPGYDNTESGTTQFSFDWKLSPVLQVLGSLGQQDVTYTGGQGNSSNQTYGLDCIAGPFGKVRLRSSLLRMNTGSAIYNSSTGGGANIPGIGGGGSGYNYDFSQRQNTTTFSTVVDYSIGHGRTLFLEWRSLDTQTPFVSQSQGGYRISSSTMRSEGKVGMTMKLTSIINLTLDMSLVRLNDRDDARYSYQARNMNLGASMEF